MLIPASNESQHFVNQSNLIMTELEKAAKALTDDFNGPKDQFTDWKKIRKLLKRHFAAEKKMRNLTAKAIAFDFFGHNDAGPPKPAPNKWIEFGEMVKYLQNSIAFLKVDNPEFQKKREELYHLLGVEI